MAQQPYQDEEIRMQLAALHTVVCWILVFWSSLIGPEMPGEWPSGPVVDAPTKTVVKGSGKPLKQDQLGNGAEADLDRDAFIASYKRQAKVILDQCLQAWSPSPGAATFVGVLHKKTGRLSNLQLLGNRTDMPDCVSQKTSTLDFSAVAPSMVRDQVIVEWTAEW